MNSSLVTADRTTHLKILAMALLASMFVVWIGISARLTAADTVSAKPSLERSLSKPSAPQISPAKAAFV